MKRYESYKDSGVKWLGEIPGHWEVYKLKYLFRLNKIKNVGNKCNTILSLSYGKIIIKKDLNEGLTPESYESYQLLNKGDIVIRSTDLQNDHTSLRTGLVKSDGAITSAYIGLKNLNVNLYDSRYYHYFLHDWDITKAIYNEGKGLRQSLNWDDIKNMLLPVLDINEQTAIANYLDSVTSKIDEAISQQQKMIDLLNERKQIIIQNAVTKGLDPNAKMKDSGVEWIGEIPEDWEVKRMRYIGDAQNGLTYSPSDIVEQSNGILVLRSSNIENGRLVFKDNVYVKKCNPKFYVKKGDIIICSRNGSASLVGKCAIVDNEIDASFGAFMMRFRSYNHNKYIYYLLSSAISHYKQLFSTSTINQLTLSIFANIKMPICSHYIQKDIADYLDDKTSKIDSYISQCNKMISLLQERKQIIINDVVTGKVKVI